MRKQVLILLLGSLPFLALAQTPVQDTTKNWKKSAIFTFALSQTSFTNWAQGGQNNLNFSTYANLSAIRKTEKSSWENSFDGAIGFQKAGNLDLRKSEDKWQFTTKFGLKATEKTFYSALLDLKSQFYDGFIFGDNNTKTFTSSFLAPAYGIASIGIDNKSIPNLSVYISPATGKFTIVGNKQLADAGAYGVDSGKMLRTEFGWYANIKFDKEVAKNVRLISKLDLFSNYKTPHAIDVTWDNFISFKINKYLFSNLSTTLIYDEDILIPKNETVNGVTMMKAAPRIQFRQIFTLGITLKF